MSDRAPWADLLGDWDPMPMLAGWIAAERATPWRKGLTAARMVEGWEQALVTENPRIIDTFAGDMNRLRAAAATRALGRTIHSDQLDDLIIPMLRALAAKEAQRGSNPVAGAVDPGGQRHHGRGDAGVDHDRVGHDGVGGTEPAATFGAIVPADTGEDDDLKF